MRTCSTSGPVPHGCAGDGYQVFRLARLASLTAIKGWDVAKGRDWLILVNMTRADLARLAQDLPVDEQLDLAQELWEHASPPTDFTLSAELKDLLEARLLEARSNPQAGIPWEEMKARLLKRA
jgi:putative addiction module component (TIGR02574 family)